MAALDAAQRLRGAGQFQLELGDKVQKRDKPTDAWKFGFVTQLEPLEVTYDDDPTGWGVSFAEVRRPSVRPHVPPPELGVLLAEAEVRSVSELLCCSCDVSALLLRHFRWDREKLTDGAPAPLPAHRPFVRSSACCPSPAPAAMPFCLRQCTCLTRTRR